MGCNSPAPNQKPLDQRNYPHPAPGHHHFPRRLIVLTGFGKGPTRPKRWDTPALPAVFEARLLVSLGVLSLGLFADRFFAGGCPGAIPAPVGSTPNGPRPGRRSIRLDFALAGG
jgi:hypothetical protein